MNKTDMNDPTEAALAKRWDDVKHFLVENDHLTVYEIAIKVGRSPSTIRNWRRRTGLSQEYPFKERPTVKKLDLPTVSDPDIWDNEDWFKKQYNTTKLGISAIARIIGKSPRLVALRLEKYGIETRSHSEAVKSTNPCSDEDWLMFHYATRGEYERWTSGSGVTPDDEGGKGWSLKRCAETAGVVPATIYNWLVRLNNEGSKVNIRDLNESVAGERNPFFGKKHTKETKARLREAFIARYGDPKSRTKTSDKTAGKERDR
jgi:transposase